MTEDTKTEETLFRIADSLEDIADALASLNTVIKNATFVLNENARCFRAVIIPD